MSQRVIIDYNSISMRTIATCDLVEKRAGALEEALEQFESESSSLQDSRSQGLMKGLREEIADILETSNRLRKTADERKGKASHRASIAQEAEANDIVREAKGLLNKMDTLSTERFQTVKEKLSKNLSDYAKEAENTLDGETTFALSNAQLNVINAVDDILLRDTLYETWMKSPDLKKEAALKEAEKALHEETEDSLEKHQDSITDSIVVDMKENRVDPSTIDKVVKNSESVKEMRQKASSEIIDESVRRETIKAIVKILSKQGFIVDKKNIKFRKKHNDVHILAQKASGEYAEFRVYLDGRFIYEFEGYEGQACQKDIEPFMNDLQSVYDVDVTNKEITWSNPDKHQTRHYRTMNQNRNRQ